MGNFPQYGDFLEDYAPKLPLELEAVLTPLEREPGATHSARSLFLQPGIMGGGQKSPQKCRFGSEVSGKLQGDYLPSALPSLSGLSSLIPQSFFTITRWNSKAGIMLSF